MLVKYLPILITGASFFIAIAFHWVYKSSFLLPSLLAALCTSAVSFACFTLIPLPGLVDQANANPVPWNAMGFALGSGFVLALLIGYLMKYAPSFFDK